MYTYGQHEKYNYTIIIMLHKWVLVIWDKISSDTIVLDCKKSIKVMTMISFQKLVDDSKKSSLVTTKTTDVGDTSKEFELTLCYELCEWGKGSVVNLL